jgi:hypothetical protein
VLNHDVIVCKGLKYDKFTWGGLRLKTSIRARI